MDAPHESVLKLRERIKGKKVEAISGDIRGELELKIEGHATLSVAEATVHEGSFRTLIAAIDDGRAIIDSVSLDKIDRTLVRIGVECIYEALYFLYVRLNDEQGK